MTKTQYLELPEGFSSPFYYGSLSMVSAFYSIDIECLPPLPLSAARFDSRRALLSVSYQSYVGVFNEGSVVVSELEFDVLVTPDDNPEVGLSEEQFLNGEEQGGLVGRLPIRVLCDNQLAIDAGRALFAEPKQMATFKCWVPSINGDQSPTWRIHATPPGSIQPMGLDITHSPIGQLALHPSPCPTFGRRKDGTIIGSNWSLYASVYITPATRIEHTDVRWPELGIDAQVLNSAPCIGTWSLTTPPVAARCRPFRVLRGNTGHRTHEAS